MSDNPERLKAILLEQASTEQQQVFASLLAQKCAEANLRVKGHRCWLFVPTQKEYDIMSKYAVNDTCPKCGKGRVVLEVFKGNIGDCLWLKCYWGKEGCDFNEYASEDE